MSELSKNILFPVDLSCDFQVNLKCVLAFLENVNGNFHVLILHTYTVPVSPSETLIQAHDELRKKSLERLTIELELAKKLTQNKRITFETISQMGSPTNVVSRLVKEKKIDCVLVGSHDGKKSQDEILSLLSRIHCSVLILPNS